MSMRTADALCAPRSPFTVEHKIETLVAAPAAVEEALASLIVDHQVRARLALQCFALHHTGFASPCLSHSALPRCYRLLGDCCSAARSNNQHPPRPPLPQDPALQYRALLTYIKRVYHPFLLREPQVSISAGGRVVAAWIYDDPRLANTTATRHQVRRRPLPR